MSSETTIIKNTPLTDRHIALGAKMAPFAGYNMPISYSGIKEEHHCVRTNVGVFDVSHMGEFIVKGKQALDLVQKVTSNDASKLAIGQAQYSCLPNTEGGIVDDLLVYRLSEDNCSEGEQAFMLVVNASNIEKDWAWISQYAPNYDTRLINISDQTALLAVQGPNALQVIQGLTDVNLSDIKYYHFTKGTVAGIENVLISATGYTGAGGFELYVQNDGAEKLWDALFESGKSLDIKPIGLGARDTLRLEKGFCLYGNDIDDTTSPIEAGLGWITKTKKASGFVNVETFKRQITEGVTHKLVGFTLDDRRVPRHGYAIFDSNDNKIGVVTSGTSSPTLDKPIGMGYVQKGFDTEGTQIFIAFGGKKLAAQVVKLPFL
ncbi:MAG: glycine cleavage system aminomethyltransferase GcvT [Saprospiraceae bacterium]|nr:glycine cleavage system aminomethyltransferase GcvT [Saprospiraceae bacterium]